MNEDDLTARARIRNAALRQFADKGVKGTTIRGVAEAAGVSPALVQHHFGSKEQLREYVEYMDRAATSAAGPLMGGGSSTQCIGRRAQVGTGPVLPVQGNIPVRSGDCFAYSGQNYPGRP
uniref:TetR/AcrR family transcriptional regulator n=1 Tax=Fodinicola feengrottensis TaxID=435914 RepID=UPI0013D78043